jgi:hypothetical protein
MMAGVNVWYLLVQIVVLGVACATPLVLMWLAFRLVQSQGQKQKGVLLGKRETTAVGITLEPEWLDGATAVEIYRRPDGLYIRPIRTKS